jgi:hypothetical protein
MVTAHLTDTETRFLTQPSPVLSRRIQWDELFMTESLCRYGLQRTNRHSDSFLVAVVKTAPYNVITLPLITTRFRLHVEDFSFILLHAIKTHRPLPILAYLFQLCNCSCRDSCADDFCEYAAAVNNTEALEWLRDPNTGDGSFPWSDWTCAGAAQHGHIEMLERLRDPDIDGGICPWKERVCARAVSTGQLETLVWLRNPKVGGGVCPWDKAWCLFLTQHYKYPAITAWINSQPDDD